MRLASICGLALAVLSAPNAAHAQSATQNWTGFYAGLHAGGAWSDYDINHTAIGDWAAIPVFAGNKAILDRGGDRDLSSSGFAGGAQAGYNFVTGGMLLGFEADITWQDLDENDGDIVVFGPGATGTFKESVSSDWLATFRPRIGFVMGAGLIYATGGLAIGDVSTRQSVFFNTSMTTASGSGSGTSMGWVVGGGGEYAIGADWSLKGEYLHVELDVDDFKLTNPSFPTFPHKVDPSDFEIDTVRIGLNYHFN